MPANCRTPGRSGSDRSHRPLSCLRIASIVHAVVAAPQSARRTSLTRPLVTIAFAISRR